MIDQRLKVTEDILASLRQMKQSAEASPSQMIWFLFNEGIPKAGAIVALRHAGVMPVEETKQAVHLHEAYQDRRAADEAFYEGIRQDIVALDKESTAAA